MVILFEKLCKTAFIVAFTTQLIPIVAKVTLTACFSILAISVIKVKNCFSRFISEEFVLKR